MADPTFKNDPYSKPAMSMSNRLARALWGIFYVMLFRPSPRFFHAWRAMLLRLFGAKLGTGCHIYPKSQIWAPWNLICEDVVAIADGVVVYNPDTVTINSHATISQDAYICGATHDYNDPDFPMISKPISIEAYAWVCARSTVLLGVTIQEGAVLALGSITSRDLEPWSVYAGTPAKKIKDRKHSERN